jgi:arylformamidase
MIYDITPLVSLRLAVWPGDTPLSREMLRDMEHGDICTLSAMRSTVHLGAHADAPCHYGRGAAGMHECSLDYYLGPCQVIRIAAQKGTLIRPEQVTAPISESRVLLCTGTYPNPEEFHPDFAALSTELVDWLHEKGVRLVGTDSPSVDPFESKALPAHRRFLAHDMLILETLALNDVPAGRYELIALPLKLEGFDASPVRAVLRTL